MEDLMNIAEKIVASRRTLTEGMPPSAQHKSAEEGGCGVVGLAASTPVAGRHLVAPARQMHNRGNGKGGGLAASGLSAQQMAVPAETLQQATLLQVAYLDPAARQEVEETAILPGFDVLQAYAVPTLDDYREVPGLEMRPPDVWRYFVRARPRSLERFAGQHGLEALDRRRVEDEYVYRNSFRLNQRFYASLGEKQAFVLCHGRDLVVFKIVGYAEQAAAYYLLENVQAHVWIAHQRYPTKGRVWHPGGAHPFVGLNEALVHNGDFANYHAVSTYLAQRNIAPLFLTDTEVSALLFDLLDRVYAYPLEATIEALAPTTERDFELLPPGKQRLYQAIQATHLHASPDGPWFFIIARSRPDVGKWQLLGITDTSMLRPQVFALHEGKVQVGLIASEKQAIDAALESLAADDERICPVADLYWNARGGSHTDGGAFVFTVQDGASMGSGIPDSRVRELVVTDKFGMRVRTPAGQAHNNPSTAPARPLALPWTVVRGLQDARGEGETWLIAGPEGVEAAWEWLLGCLTGWDYGQLTGFCHQMVDLACGGGDGIAFAIALLSRLRDRRYDPGTKRRASVLALADRAIVEILEGIPPLPLRCAGGLRRIAWDTRAALRPPAKVEKTLVLDAAGFPPEGDDSAARLIVEAAAMGWQRFVTYNWRGGRFCGCGLGPASSGVHIDVYGSSGDYLGSGLQGAEVHIHGSAQDQVGQILKGGKLVIHGDVGQTFLYGAKGGEAYLLGNAAGRPLINAAGNPRVVINGTCLDYLAESFMAGDPLNGGGFVVLNGITFDAHGCLVSQPTPYPGGNLFSLASGGAIYIRDPHGTVSEEQLNGGRIAPLTAADWSVIQPYLAENERLFGICVADLLTVNGQRRQPGDVYRKVAATRPRSLS
jgi:glutamate synthase domain-containing protein 1/glutamate synthase domain-containing protein 3